MRTDMREAIESARTIAFERRPHNRAKVIALLLGLVRELPEDMTAGEIREELENG